MQQQLLVGIKYAKGYTFRFRGVRLRVGVSQRVDSKQSGQQIQEAVIIIMWQYDHLFQQQSLPAQRNPEIARLRELIRHTLGELDSLEQQKIKGQEQKYLAIFISILRNISREVLAAKVAYHSIDRERLVDERKDQLTSNIIWTRGDIHHKERELAGLKLELQRMERQNQVGEFENECIKKVVSKKQVDTKQSRKVYLTAYQPPSYDSPQPYSAPLLEQEGSSKQEGSKQWGESQFVASKRQSHFQKSRRMRQYELYSLLGRSRPVSSGTSWKERGQKRKHTSLRHVGKC